MAFVDPAIMKDLEQFNEGFAPSVGGRKPGLDSLQDGEYEMQIASASLEKTKNTGDTVLKISYRIPSGAVSMVEQVFFFRNQENVNSLGRDLETLGFDTSSWKPPTGNFASGIVELVAKDKLVGLMVKAKKTTNSSTGGKTYHNLKFISLLPKFSQPPAFSQSAVPQQSESSSEVPF